MKKRIALIMVSALLLFSLTSCDLFNGLVDDFKEALGINTDPDNLFVEGVLPVKSGDLYGYVDKDGNYVITPQYSKVTHFYGGFALAYSDDSTYCIINPNGGAVWSNTGDVELMPSRYYESLLEIVADGEKVICDNNIHLYSENDLQGYCNINGIPIIEARFDVVLPFQEDAEVAAVCQESKWGFINRDGEFVIEPEYDRVSMVFVEGLMAVELGDKCGYVNDKGEEVVAPQFDDAENFSEGVAAVKLGGKWGYIKKDGKWAIQPQYDGAGAFGEFKRARVELNGKYGYIDEDGKYVVSPRFDDARDFSGDYAAVSDGDNWGFISLTGEYLVDPIYDEVGDFVNGAAWVKNRGKYGFVNDLGDEIVSPMFPQVADFAANGLAAILVDEEGRVGYLDKNGEAAIEAIFEGVPTSWGYRLPDGCSFYDDGYAVAYVDGKYGVINKDGVFVVAPIYDEIVLPDYNMY